jgi:hypothetical protein
MVMAPVKVPLTDPWKRKLLEPLLGGENMKPKILCFLPGDAAATVVVPAAPWSSLKYWSMVT